MELRLHSPVGAGREYDLVYAWPSPEDKEVNYTEEDLAEEIRETFSAVLCDHPEIRFPIPPISVLCEYEALRGLCDRWNTLIGNYTSGRSFPSTKATLPQAQHIIGQIYNRTVTYPERLNQYSAFSPNVYGETSPKMVSHMIRQLDITEDDTFLDLGSGVGQVVLQMAAAANFKRCVGIETCETPCEYAVGLQNEFKKVMKWYGKSHTEFHLYNGDFLDPKFRDTILKSSIIFANNYAFGPEVDHQLKEIFAELDQGVRIVSSKEFSSPNFRINQRNLTDIGTIMHVTTMSPFEGAVSWTHSKVSFYLHEIDRTKLERYFEECSKSHLQNAVSTEKSRRRSVKPHNSSERKENSQNPEDKPKKRSSRPRIRFSFPSRKKPRRSESSANRHSGDEVSMPASNFLESQEIHQPMPKLQPEMIGHHGPESAVVQMSRSDLQPEMLNHQAKPLQLQPKMQECHGKRPKLQPEVYVSQPMRPYIHPQMAGSQPMRPYLFLEMPERHQNKPGPLPEMPARQLNKLENHLEKRKSTKQASLDKSKNQLKPPKKRKSEVEILQNTWDIYRKENRIASASHSCNSSSQTEIADPYVDAPWRNVPITDGPPKCVDELLARMRVQYFDMMKSMQNAAYREKILDESRVVKERNEQLKKTKAYLEEVVGTLLDNGKQLLTAQMAKLGYKPDDVQEMINELQFLSGDQARLSLEKAARMREIAILENNIRQHLLPDINHQVENKHRLKKAVTELTDELHHITSQTPPTVFPNSPPSEGEFSTEDAMHPSRLYVNDVRIYDCHSSCEDDIPRRSVVTAPVPSASANESTIPQFKISILPKKRR